MFKQHDARLAAAVGHVGDFLAVRAEARGEHELLAAREVAHIGAVLIHDGETLDAALLGSGLVDEHDARIEIALLAGEPLVDRVGDEVGDAAPVVGLGEELGAGELLAGEHVPQPEFDLEAAVGLTRDAPDHEALRVDHAPILKARSHVDILDLLDECRGLDRREQAAAAQIGGDHAREVAPRLRVSGAAARAAEEVEDRDRQGLDGALRDVEPQHRVRGAAQRDQRRSGRAGREDLAAGKTDCRERRREKFWLHAGLGGAFVHPPNMSRGSKVTSTSFQTSYLWAGNV